MNMPETKIEERIKQEARNAGFHLARICAVEEGERVPYLQRWLEQQYHGSMKYMENAARSFPHQAFPDVRTMVVVGLNYRWPAGASIPAQDGMISKYAWGGDYHRIMKPMLQNLASRIQSIAFQSAVKVYVDTGPVVEKYWAQKAGLGWIGKHTNLINREGSSWFFLGVLLTDLPLQPDEPVADHCGSCERCIEVCPTQAILEPYVLDARRCISYLTIELRESIPREFRALIGNRIFGCDDCQDVCPWNRFAYAGDPRLNPRTEILSASLLDYLELKEEEFRTVFAGTNVLRAKYRGFLRNCLVAAGNARRPELRVSIERHLNSEDEMLREHAVWALAQFGDSSARLKLQEMQGRENSEAVLTEINHCLSEFVET